MERSGNRIIFNAAEQNKFGVAPVVTLDSAIETAEGFMNVTDNINNRTEDPGDSTNRHQQAQRQQLNHRATEMRTFARDILGKCADRVAERQIDSLS